jgi:hypothetical protein
MSGEIFDDLSKSILNGVSNNVCRDLFNKTLSTFLNYVHDILTLCYRNNYTHLLPETISILKFYILSHSSDILIDCFVKYTNIMWTIIKNKNYRVLTKNIAIILTNGKINILTDQQKSTLLHLSNLFTFKLTTIQKGIIFDYLHDLVKISIIYCSINKAKYNFDIHYHQRIWFAYSLSSDIEIINDITSDIINDINFINNTKLSGDNDLSDDDVELLEDNFFISL